MVAERGVAAAFACRVPGELEGAPQCKAWFMANWRFSLAMQMLLASLPHTTTQSVLYLDMTFQPYPLGKPSVKDYARLREYKQVQDLEI